MLRLHASRLLISLLVPACPRFSIKQGALAVCRDSYWSHKKACLWQVSRETSPPNISVSHLFTSLEVCSGFLRLLLTLTNYSLEKKNTPHSSGLWASFIWERFFSFFKLNSPGASPSPCCTPAPIRLSYSAAHKLLSESLRCENPSSGERWRGKGAAEILLICMYISEWRSFGSFFFWQNKPFRSTSARNNWIECVLSHVSLSGFNWSERRKKWSVNAHEGHLKLTIRPDFSKELPLEMTSSPTDPHHLSLSVSRLDRGRATRVLVISLSKPFHTHTHNEFSE